MRIAYASALVILFVTCAQPTQVPALARAEHAWFGGKSQREVELRVDSSGGVWSSGAPDPVVHPQLAAAWERAEAPRTPLIGRDSGLWLRALRVVSAEDGAMSLEAKALAPFPVRLTLLLDDGGGEQEISADDSSTWNRNTHFACVRSTATLAEGSLVVVRVEGGYQAFETRLRVRLVP